ncbi:MAG: TonB-dependent receptor [Halieaceae bacterium]|nr:TonB-dependent receptor [Halieaceae bacterium]
MKNSGNNKFSGVTLVFATSLLVQPVMLPAQELVLEEVMVTAQRKEQTLNEAPITVNVIDGETMREAVIFQADELSKMTSGVEVRWEGDTNTGVGLRGVGTFTQQSTPPRVATYLDGHFLGSQAAVAFAALFDMERVQILRGPQGTHYGQPSPTGALLLETANPDLNEMEGYVQTTLQDPEGYNLQGAISVPLIDNVLAARIAVLTDQRQTGLENIFHGDEERNRDAIRAKLLWQPIDNLSFKLGYHYFETDDSDVFRAVESLSPDAEYQLDTDDRISIEDFHSRQVLREDHLVNLLVNGDFGPVSFSFYAGDTWNDRYGNNDNDRTNVNIATLDNRGEFKQQRIYEGRASIQATDWWETTLGFYHAKAAAQTDVTVNQQVAAAGGSVFQIILDIPSASTTRALFTNNEFSLGDKTDLIVGVRYNEFDNSSKNIIDGVFNVGATLLSDGSFTTPIVSVPNAFPCVPGTSIAGRGSPCLTSAASEKTSYTGTVKLAHSFSDAANVYFSIDKGFRPGAPNFDTTGIFQPTPEDPDSGLNSYDSEEVDSFELGSKGTFMDGRAQYTAAVFLSTYEGYQINPLFSAWNPVSGSVAVATNRPYVNVDEAEQKGIEAEIRMLVSDRLSVFAAATWAKVEFTDGQVHCTDPSQPALSPSNRFNTCDAKGGVASPQPELTAVFQGTYSVPNALMGADWTLSAHANYRDDFEEPGDVEGRFESDGFWQVDASTGLSTDSWSLRLFVKNVFDEAGVMARRSSNLPVYNMLTMINPRTTGIIASYQF